MKVLLQTAMGFMLVPFTVGLASNITTALNGAKKSSIMKARNSYMLLYICMSHDL
jgi:hypothetical protein